MIFRVLKSCIVCLLLLLVVCCSDKPDAMVKVPQKILPNEMTVKERLLENLTVYKAKELEAKNICNLSDNYQTSFPSSLVLDDKGQVYVSDNSGQAILKIDSQLKKVNLVTNQNLKYPNTIKLNGSKIFVTDNDGIKVFEETGNLLETVKTFFSVNSFSINSSNDFFVNPNFLENNQSNPIVIKLDKTGKRFDEFGQLQSPEIFNGTERKVLVETYKNMCVLAYKYRSLIEIYDSNTNKLVRSFQPTHPIFEELEKLKNDKTFTNPQDGIVVLPTYISGLKLLKDKLYVLVSVPNPEIIEFNLNGTELKRLRSNTVKANGYFGFDAYLVGDVPQFIVGMMNSYRKPTVTSFTQNDVLQSKK